MTPDEFSYQPLADLVEGGDISYGIVQPGTHDAAGVPIVRVRDVSPGGTIDRSNPLRVDSAISQRHHKTVLRGGEVLVTIVGTVGSAAVVPPELVGWNVARAIAVLRPTAVSPQWLQYCFSMPDVAHSIQGALNTTVQATLNLSDLKKIKVPVASPSDRLAIEEVLGALDDKIAANNKVATISRELISASYARMLSANEWNYRSLFDVFSVDFGAAFKGEHFSDVGVGRPLLRIRDLKTGRPQIWTTEERPDECVISPGDVVVGMDAEFRPSWWTGDPAVLNQRVCRVRGKGVGSAFVVESLKAPLARLENEKTATTVIHLNKSDLNRVEIPFPSESAINEFEIVSEPLALHYVQMARECKALTKTRGELLPLLMSGKLRVKDAEKKVEAIA
ncbi:restriction endonuclease subunit S [Nocardia africana]|uniref:Restriction endonuclease subunit S n=1 Tax=Nocardia africana TaxID=134964 RepID=A0ABW6NCR6_9NOCA